MQRKIDIYLKNTKGNYAYECTTSNSRTCKEAKAKFLARHNYLDSTQVKASFSTNTK